MLELQFELDAPLAEVVANTFLAVRVGDVQKQSKLNGLRTFKFPDTEGKNCGHARIEVFQRVGHATVSLDTIATEGNSVNVPCQFPQGGKNLAFKLSSNGGKKIDQKICPIDAEKKSHARRRLDEAQNYLAEHHIEDSVAEVMREMIRKKPADPHVFMANELILRGFDASSGGKLPSLSQSKKATAPPGNSKDAFDNPTLRGSKQTVDAAADTRDDLDKVKPSSREKLAPIRSASTPASKVASQRRPFNEYYPAHFRSIGPAAFTSIHTSFAKGRPNAKPSVAPEDVGLVKSPLRNRFLPSVGSWFMRIPKQIQQPASSLMTLVAASQPLPPAEDDLRQTACQLSQMLSSAASDGSLANALASISSAPKDDFAQTVSQICQMLSSAAGDGSLETALTSISSAPARQTTYAQHPSVGTWLTWLEYPELPPPVVAVAPVEPVRSAASFTLLPSVGTWLSARPDADPSVSEEQLAVTDARQEDISVFRHKPSVGSWLSRTPAKVAKPWYYEEATGDNSDLVVKLQDMITDKDRELMALKAHLKMLGIELPNTQSQPQQQPKLQQPSLQQPSEQVSQPQQKSPAPREPGPAAALGLPFLLKPSVGSWYAKKRKVMYEPPPPPPPLPPPKPATRTWQQSASIGTWLAERVFDDDAPSILEKPHSELLGMSNHALIMEFRAELDRKEAALVELKKQSSIV